MPHKDPQKRAEYHARYHREHRKEFSAYGAKSYRINKDHIMERRKIYRRDNAEKVAAQAASYYQKNKSKIAKHNADRRKNDPYYKLAIRVRDRFNDAFKNGRKSGSAVRDLGCSIGAFRLFIENQFESGMSWDNYGEWHLDHVQPLASFDLTERSQFLTACNWLNYQPLWAIDNTRKGAR